MTPGCLSATGRGVQLLGVLPCVLLLTATEHDSCVAGSTATRRSSCVANSASEHRCFRLCEVSAPLCRGYWFRHYRPCPKFLRFLSLRFLRCRLVSLTSVLKDSVSAADSALDSTPWFVCPVLISSLSVLLEEYGPISRGAGSPDASPVSSSLSMGTIPKEDQSALVPSDSDPVPPLKPTVESHPDDDIGAACCDHSGEGGGSSGISGGSWYSTSKGGVPRPRAPWGLPTHTPSTRGTCVFPCPPGCLPSHYL